KSKRMVSKERMENGRFGLAARGVTGEVRNMSRPSETSAARVSAKAAGDGLELTVAGRWKITEPRPRWKTLVAGPKPARIVIAAAEDLDNWDSSLLLFLFEAQQWCRANDVA